MFSFRTVGLLPALRFFKGFLRLGDDSLNFPGSHFHRALDLQTGIIGQLACFRPDFAFNFVKLANGLVFRARSHHISPFGQDQGQQSRRNSPE